MKKWVCPVCGYIWEGEEPPEKCPQCKVPGSKFTEMKGELTWAAEHVVGVGKQFGEDVPEEVRAEILAGLKSNFEGECSEVGMYLAMAEWHTVKAIRKSACTGRRPGWRKLSMQPSSLSFSVIW